MKSLVRSREISPTGLAGVWEKMSEVVSIIVVLNKEGSQNLSHVRVPVEDRNLNHLLTCQKDFKFLGVKVWSSGASTRDTRLWTVNMIKKSIGEGEESSPFGLKGRG